MGKPQLNRVNTRPNKGVLTEPGRSRMGKSQPTAAEIERALRGRVTLRRFSFEPEDEQHAYRHAIAPCTPPPEPEPVVYERPIFTVTRPKLDPDRPWTDEEVEWLKVQASRGEFSRTRAGELIDRSRDEVAGACHRHGIKFKKRSN